MPRALIFCLYAFLCLLPVFSSQRQAFLGKDEPETELLSVEQYKWPNYRAFHSGQCWDIEGGSRSTGARLIQWPCNGGENQGFVVEFTTTYYNNPHDGYYYHRIYNVKSGLALTVNGDKITQETFITGENQLWRVSDSTKLWIFRRSYANKANGKCMDVKDYSYIAGTPITTYSCNDGDNQWFY
jgi:hypothetical protein